MLVLREITHISEPPQSSVFSPLQAREQFESDNLVAKELRVSEHQHSLPYSNPA